MKDLKIVPVDELHTSIRTFIVDTKTIIGDYEDMKSLILTMIKAGYMFNMDRDRLRDAMEDLTFMLCPDDDANKDRVERGLEYDDDDDSESGESDDEVDTKHRTPRSKNNDINNVEDIGNASDLN